MRKLVLLVGLLSALSIRTSQAQERIEIEHFAPIPCATACPHWDYTTAAGLDVCANPGPPKSFDETIVRITGSAVVRIDAYSYIDYDTFICTDEAQSRQVDPLACATGLRCSSIPEDCYSPIGTQDLGIGCAERYDVSLAMLRAAGSEADTFRIVSYNWSDIAPLPITISGPAEIVWDELDNSLI
jgi:hypothetical protein